MRLATFGMILFAITASGESRLVSVGGRRLAIDCAGERSAAGTVVLLAGGGRTLKDWAKVQPEVAKFARVCSYDRAGLGESEKVAQPPQLLDDVLGDLHVLLQEAGEKPPYVLAGHSIAGIYARRFASKFPGEVKGLVMVDSSHEEQGWRFREIDAPGMPATPELAELFPATPGRRLEWRTELPLIVLGQGELGPKPPPLTEEQYAAMNRVWRVLQEDLAKRSPKGEFRLAKQSGHYIHRDEPELVIQAIRNVF
jgi:pimeloyl-ACP methyl ester carboxylesterase